MSTGQDSFDVGPNGMMDGGFGFDDVDPDAPGSRGGGRLPEGGYKFAITEVIVQNDKGSTEIECEVLAAKDSNLVGRKHKEYLSWPDGQHSADYNRIKKEQLLAWCYAAKTTSPEEIKARQQARQGFSTAWLEAMVGRQVLGFVKEDTYTSNSGSEKTSAKCEGRVWAIDNPKGKGIPGWIDTGKPAGGNGTGGNGTGGQAATPTQPATQPVHSSVSTPSVPAVDPFAGLV